MSPEIDAVIVSHNTRDDLAACLRALTSLNPSPLRRIIVVDNASTDGSVETLGPDWRQVDLVALGENVGFGAANNVGIRRSTARLLLLLNADTIVPAGAIEALASRLDATGAVAAGPKLVDRAGRPEVSFGPMLSPVTEVAQWVRQRLARSSGALGSRLTARLVGRERFVDWVTAACCLVVREAVVEAGLFDERYFMYEEDVDLCAALRARGGRILFTPAAEVVHARGGSSRAAPDATRRHYDVSHQRFYEKHHPGWAPLLAFWKRVRGRAIR